VSSSGTVEGDARIRLFCALTLDDETLDRLVAWQASLPAGNARVVPRANLHLTLAFLGHRPAAELDGIGRELGEAAGGAGGMVLREQRYRETRSVGMVVFSDETGAAGALAADLHRRLAPLGVYEPEARPWLPHLTVVRFRERPRLTPPLPQLGPVVPSGAAVYMSQLRPGGAEYVVVQKFGLNRGG
jgi:2'-5' RNA ligase